MKKICILPNFKKTESGGPSSFKKKLEFGLFKRNVEVISDLDNSELDAVLVINGTRQINKLWKLKKKGVRIVHRLGVPNSLHRQLSFGLRVFLMAEVRNVLMRLIRNIIADKIIYQSEFVRKRWDSIYGESRVGSSIIYNGVDLTTFSPQGPKYNSKADICIISVEGTQGADPFDITLSLGYELEKLRTNFEILVLGKILPNTPKSYFEKPFVRFIGFVPNNQLPYYYRGSTFFLSTDILTAGCPNSVLESLSCGTPVLGYDAGPLREVIDKDSGICVSCNGNPIKGYAPENYKELVEHALLLCKQKRSYSEGARKLAIKKYDVEQMVNEYYKVLFT